MECSTFYLALTLEVEILPIIHINALTIAGIAMSYVNSCKMGMFWNGAAWIYSVNSVTSMAANVVLVIYWELCMSLILIPHFFSYYKLND